MLCPCEEGSGHLIQPSLPISSLQPHKKALSFFEPTAESIGHFPLGEKSHLAIFVLNLFTLKQLSRNCQRSHQVERKRKIPGTVTTVEASYTASSPGRFSLALEGKSALGTRLQAIVNKGSPIGFSVSGISLVRNFKEKSGRDSGLKLKVSSEGGMLKTTLGITGLHEILGGDYGIEEPNWGPSTKRRELLIDVRDD